MGKVSPGVLSEPHAVLTSEEWRQLGRKRRKFVPRSSHAEWAPPPDRPDPVGILEEQAKERVPDLVPIRHGRMSASPFAYFRGAAAPFEWDVKRLAASVTVAARDNGFDTRAERTAARRCAHVYRTEMANFAQMRFLDTWYSRIDVDQVCQLFDAVQSRKAIRRRSKDVRRAYRHTSVQAVDKLCHVVDGQHRIKAVPPVVVRFGIEHEPTIVDELRGAVDLYRETLQADRREVLRHYYFGDFARKVVGVGSVGTEAFLLLLLGDRPDEPLILQLKEAQESVLAPFAGSSEYKHQGERVVRGQKLMQAAGDPFLGWTSGLQLDGAGAKEYYVRQLRDMKGAMNVPAMDPPQLTYYAGLCGWALARSHARTGRAAMISGYLGSSDQFDLAIEDFAVAYADQNQIDYQRLLNAIESRRLPAVVGL